MDDITIIYVTANELSDKWMEYQIGVLWNAIGNTPVISISRKPMSLGKNIVEDRPKCYWNIYASLLEGCLAAETKYVGMAEDDTLYTKTHYDEYRPADDAVAYDRSRWSLFAWDKKPMYCLRQRISNCSLIAPREYLIDALQERAKMYPKGMPDNVVGEVGRPDIERRLKLTVHKKEEWYSYGPIVQLNHPQGSEERQQRKWKRHAQVRAYDIPRWGKAIDISRIYNEGYATSNTKEI